MRAAALIGVVVLAATAGSAHAADRAQLPCVVQQLTDADRAAWRASAERLVTTGPDEQVDPPAALRQRLNAAAATCGVRYGWSAAARNDAALIAQASFALAPARERLVAVGVDPAKVEAALAGMAASDRAALGSGAGARALVQALKAQGFDMEGGGAAGTAVGMFAALHAMNDDATARFATE